MTTKDKYEFIERYTEEPIICRIPKILFSKGVLNEGEMKKIQLISDYYNNSFEDLSTNKYGIMAVNLMYEKLIKFQEKL